MKWRLVVCLIALIAATTAHAASCPVTVGTLNLNAVVTRSSGISPLLVFFDATGTTDSAITGNKTVFQDVSFSWNFGDNGASGTGTWAFGSNPNGNSKNAATGAIAAHLYITAADTTYSATVTAFDGTNTASCTLGVTAFDPSGSNGFSGTATTCASSSGTPIAGSGGCPAGAAVLSASTLSTALNSGSLSGKRRLLKCGDTFTGGVTISGVKWSVGAYGACPGVAITSANQANYPQVSGTIAVSMLCAGGGSSVLQTCDGRISDIVGDTGASPFVQVTNNFAFVPAQVTLWNLFSNATNENFYGAECVQCGLIQLVTHNQGVNQGTFWNLAGNMCQNASSSFNCGQGASPQFNPIGYTAMIGGSYNGTGAPNNGSGIETVRISGCQQCVFSNNNILNANNVGGVLKFQSNNTQNSQCQWLGQFSQNTVISDNLFGGTSGAELTDIIAQNQNYDERLRNIVIERNTFAPSISGHQLLFGAMNGTVRDNVFINSGAQFGQRGFEGTSNNTPGGTGATCSGTGTTAAAVISNYPAFNEFYNNTCDGGGCGAFTTGGAITGRPASSSLAQNNLTFNSSAISNGGSGNVVSNNSPNTTSNPGFVNASGTFGFISDFKPTANFTGATSVPNYYDAVLAPWLPTWNLGAIKASVTPSPIAPRHRLLISRLGVQLEVDP
jgi:hypothetical protein